MIIINILIPSLNHNIPHYPPTTPQSVFTREILSFSSVKMENPQPVIPENVVPAGAPPMGVPADQPQDVPPVDPAAAPAPVQPPQAPHEVYPPPQIIVAEPHPRVMEMIAQISPLHHRQQLLEAGLRHFCTSVREWQDFTEMIRASQPGTYNPDVLLAAKKYQAVFQGTGQFNDLRDFQQELQQIPKASLPTHEMIIKMRDHLIRKQDCLKLSKLIQQERTRAIAAFGAVVRNPPVSVIKQILCVKYDEDVLDHCWDEIGSKLQDLLCPFSGALEDQLMGFLPCFPVWLNQSASLLLVKKQADKILSEAQAQVRPTRKRAASGSQGTQAPPSKRDKTDRRGYEHAAAIKTAVDGRRIFPASEFKEFVSSVSSLSTSDVESGIARYRRGGVCFPFLVRKSCKADPCRFSHLSDAEIRVCRPVHLAINEVKRLKSEVEL
jgi:hypothetical protein